MSAQACPGSQAQVAHLLHRAEWLCWQHSHQTGGVQAGKAGAALPPARLPGPEKLLEAAAGARKHLQQVCIPVFEILAGTVLSQHEQGQAQDWTAVPLQVAHMGPPVRMSAT